MFGWLFERKVKGTIYFETVNVCIDGNSVRGHTEAWKHEKEVGDMLIMSEGLLKGFLLINNRNECYEFLHNKMKTYITNYVDLYKDADNKVPAKWAMEVECWEGTWKQICQLDWVVSMSEVV